MLDDEPTVFEKNDDVVAFDQRKVHFAEPILPKSTGIKPAKRERRRPTNFADEDADFLMALKLSQRSEKRDRSSSSNSSSKSSSNESNDDDEDEEEEEEDSRPK